MKLHAMGAVALASPALAEVKVPEGTEFSIRIDGQVSSQTVTEGDRFTVTLDGDVKLADGTMLYAYADQDIVLPTPPPPPPEAK